MNKIIVALDGYSKIGDLDRVIKLAQRLSGKVWGYKVNDFFVRYGTAGILPLSELGNIMVDMKFYDIPNTVENHCRSLQAALGDKIEIATVHAHGGFDMMAAAAKVMPGKIAAVTVLTSFSAESYQQVSPSTQTIRERVWSLASLSLSAGCSHVVCSPDELLELRNLALKKVIPGIRPLWHSGKDDQKRTATPAEAIKNGADLLVIGRPITQAVDPLDAVNRTNDEINS